MHFLLIFSKIFSYMSSPTTKLLASFFTSDFIGIFNKLFMIS